MCIYTQNVCLNHFKWNAQIAHSTENTTALASCTNSHRPFCQMVYPRGWKKLAAKSQEGMPGKTFEIVQSAKKKDTLPFGDVLHSVRTKDKRIVSFALCFLFALHLSLSRHLWNYFAAEIFTRAKLNVWNFLTASKMLFINTATIYKSMYMRKSFAKGNPKNKHQSCIKFSNFLYRG